ncbi:hypothetical protein O7626_30340 [Micromonospora sp. WMMD1102]|uniref:hypothetical protein n=1 Tax=Micromonospora sp. WMMD1102 TaxID=3016105 RepID=UPI002414E83E|nr:hypothetical protein [Micromonospora sp. WMMD1102]MDG4790171.1 hypothetical protein [Micromonospora sp. WMMD1102]
MQSVEMRRWTAEDGAGRGTLVEPPLDYDLTTADPHHRSTDAEFASPEPRPIIYGPDDLGSTALPSPPSTNPNTLTKQLTARPIIEGPAGILLAIDHLLTVYPTPRPVRAAVLRVLAGVTGLRYHERVADRLGRPGIAVSLDRDNLRYSLIFDPTSGQLLASEQLLIDQHEYLDVPAGHVVYYTLFLRLTRRADFTWPDRPWRAATDADRHGIPLSDEHLPSLIEAGHTRATDPPPLTRSVVGKSRDCGG